MSRTLERLKQPEQHHDLADTDHVEAEHDPAASRRASLADLRRQDPVQRKGAGDASNRGVHDVAARGVASPGGKLPHFDAIQRSFGAHDVSNIQAHVGDESARAMGAEAYATGNHVVFDKEPDLHTAAHEAAHVVQQAKGVNLYGGVGKAGDTHEQQADAVADRVVAGESAEDLLGEPTAACADAEAVQAKPAPAQAHADGAVILAIQAHAKLTAARMHASAATITNALQMDTSSEAGSGPMHNTIEAAIALVDNDLDALAAEMSRVPDVLRGTLDPELGAVYGAFHMSWAPALNKVWASLGWKGLVTNARNKMQHVFRIVGREEADMRAVLPPRIADPALAAEQRDDELMAAELEAIKWGMHSVETALDLVKADLHSSVPDQSKQALALNVSVQQLVNVLEPVNPDHIGKISKLPILIKKVEALQAEVMSMKDEDKGKALATTIGYNTQLSSNLHKLKTKIAAISAVKKSNRKR